MFHGTKPVLFALTLLVCPLVRGGIDDGQLTKLMERVHTGNALVQVPLASRPPVVDGRLSPREWDGAAILCGFSTQGAKGQLLGNKPGQVLLQRTKEHLYIAVRTATPNDSPGGGLVCAATKRDDPAIAGDDTVEFTFHNSRRPDTILQIVCNPSGACLDIRRDLASGNSDAKWNFAGVSAGSVVESFWWVTEMKIPLSELTPAGGVLKFNVARNWCDTGTFSTLNKVRKNFLPADMIRLDFSDSPVTVKQNTLGNPDDGNWDTESTAVNSSGREVVFAVMLHEYAFKKADGKVKRSHTVHALEKKILSPGETGKLVLRRKTASNALIWFATAVLDAKTKKVLHNRLIQGRKSLFTGRRPLYAAGEIKKTGRFRVYDYPGFGHAAFFFNFTSPAPENLQMTGPDGKAVKFPITARGGEHYCRAEIPSALGVYTFTLPGGREVCRITRKNFPWLGNDLGREKVVIPPFTPIRTCGNEVEVLFRKHRLNHFGLWDSVESKGTELLAEPMSFELVSEGKTVPWRGEIKKLELRNGGHDASYRAESANAAGISLTVAGYAEYDGFFWNRFELDNPVRRPVDRLTVRIPLKDAQMPLFHVISNTIRTNPAGALPAGEGELWNGTKLVRQLHFGQPVMHKQFVPYVWLGGVEKGVCWFMDSSFGCRLSQTLPQVRISRKGKTVLLEIDIINIPDRESKRVFEFGLQATPVKPVEPALLPMTRDGRGWVSGELPNLGDFNQVRGGFASQWAVFPLANDYSLYKKVISIISGDGRYSGDIKNDIRTFFDRYLPILRQTIDKDYPGQSAKILKSACDASSLSDKRRPPSRPIMYTDPRLVYRYDEGAQAFRSEWWNPARINYTGVWRSTLTPSLQDYLVYHHEILLRCGLRGINLDDAYLMPDDNPETVAKIDASGTIHSNAGILQLRSYVKRLATMMHTRFHIYPRYVEPHMTNALIVPAFSFADGQLGMEQHYGESPRTACFPADEILATYTGRQIGAKPLALPGLLRKNMPPERWKKEFPVLTRSCIALSLPFGITMRTSIRVKYEHFDIGTYQAFYKNLAEFGIAEKDCVFEPCFEQKSVSSGSKDIRIGLFKRPGKVLVCAANLCKEPAAADLEIDASSLGLKENFKMTDWEKRTPITKKFTLAPGDFKLVLLSE